MAPPAKARRFRVRGASMEPLLRQDDCVRVRPAPPEEFRLGDVLVLGGADGPARRAAAPPDDWIVHRLWWKRRVGGRWRLWTRGDWSDHWDSRDWEPLGVVDEIERGGVRVAWRGRRARLAGLAFLAFSCAARLAGRGPAGLHRAVLAGLSWSSRGFGPARRAVRRLLLPWPALFEGCRDASGGALEALCSAFWSRLAR